MALIETLQFMFLDAWWFWGIAFAAPVFLVYIERIAYLTAAHRTDTRRFTFVLVMALLTAMCLFASVVRVQTLSSDLSQLNNLPKSPPSTTTTDNPWGPPLIDGRQLWGGTLLMILNFIRAFGLDWLLVIGYGGAVFVLFVKGYVEGWQANDYPETKTRKRRR